MKPTLQPFKTNTRTQLKTQAMLLAAFLLLVLLSVGLVYFSLSSYSHNDFYRLLKERAESAARVQLEGQSAPVPPAGDGSSLFSDGNEFFIYLDEGLDFALIAEELELPKGFFDELIEQGEAQHHYKEIFSKGIRYTTAKGTYAVVVKAENYYESHHFAFLQQVLLATLAIGFVLAVLISVFLAQTIFKPLRLITDKVNQISSESLYLRLDDQQSNDELGALIRTFNNMLDRIETSFETQNNFISNASHEFRTPLTAIIGEADVALAKKREAREYEDTLRIILQEAEKLDLKTQALLFLAQTGFRDKAAKGEPLRVDELLWDVKETLSKINPKARLNFDLSRLPENPSMLKVSGHTQLLHLAFSNIISNACKYSDNALVSVSIQLKVDKLYIGITDQGIGIPSDELRHIYDPFFRASNTDNYEGYGIGMPLARNIIRMHKGEIIVVSEQNLGTEVTVVLPVDRSTKST